MTSFIFLLHYKADTSIRRIVWCDEERIALPCGQAIFSKDEADISIKQTLFCPRDIRFIENLLYFHLKNVLKNYLVFKLQITGNVSILVNAIVFHCKDPDSIPCQYQ